MADVPGSGENLVEIDDLHFDHGDRQILKGINLRIPRGHVVAILGTSGSGKTTLLRLLSGQLRPKRGRVRVAGKVVHELNTRELYKLRRHMGMMFQAGGLFSDLSVFVMYQFDKLLISGVVAPTEVAHYEVASRSAQALGNVSSAPFVAFAPARLRPLPGAGAGPAADADPRARERAAASFIGSAV